MTIHPFSHQVGTKTYQFHDLKDVLAKATLYFETGQGSALSANAHHGMDQQTCEVRAYAVARRFHPLLGCSRWAL